MEAIAHLRQRRQCMSHFLADSAKEQAYSQSIGDHTATMLEAARLQHATACARMLHDYAVIGGQTMVQGSQLSSALSLPLGQPYKRAYLDVIM